MWRLGDCLGCVPGRQRRLRKPCLSLLTFSPSWVCLPLPNGPCFRRPQGRPFSVLPQPRGREGHRGTERRVACKASGCQVGVRIEVSAPVPVSSPADPSLHRRVGIPGGRPGGGAGPPPTPRSFPRHLFLCSRLWGLLRAEVPRARLPGPLKARDTGWTGTSQAGSSGSLTRQHAPAPGPLLWLFPLPRGTARTYLTRIAPQ